MARPGITSILNSLNPAQRQAVTTTEGPLLVLAGAGTGKTRVITYRIAHLLALGVPPANILAVTFTNKAAREMRERIGELLGSRPKELTLSTFHSLGSRILRADAEAAGLRANSTIHDTSDQVSLVRTILRDIRGVVSSSDARGVLARISRAKNAGKTPADVLDEAETDDDWLLSRVFHRYEEELRNLNAVDFDDLIGVPVRLLESNDAVREKYQSRFRYIMVDEYQDTNGAQYRFTRALVGPERNLCVVGDDDQSIYAFRGAEVDKILRFEKDFPGSVIVKLEDNYRSSASILRLANAVIRHGAERHPKTLRATIGEGPPVEWIEAPDAIAEVEGILTQIGELRAREGLAFEDFAILLRSAIQARPFEEKLRLRHIPYTLVGGQSWFDRKEVRDVVAYWKVIANEKDDLSLLRILNVPRRGLGDGTVRTLDSLARTSKRSILEVLQGDGDDAKELPPRARTACREIAELFARASQKLREGRAYDACRDILEEIGYEAEVRRLYPDPLLAEARWNAVEALLDALDRWTAENPGEELATFLGTLTLDDRSSSEKEQRGVALMTLHSAKGLEFPVVFLPGVEEDLLPHRHSVADGDRAIEEERRLFYVGITRARRRLFIWTARTRSVWGKERERLPSRFLIEAEDGGIVRSLAKPPPPASEDDVKRLLEGFRKRRERAP